MSPAELAVAYLIFNVGHGASGGDALLRPALCDDALHLARDVHDGHV